MKCSLARVPALVAAMVVSVTACTAETTSEEAPGLSRDAAQACDHGCRGGTVEVCHAAGKHWKPETLCVSPSAARAHIAHGDQPCACDAVISRFVDADGDGFGAPGATISACPGAANVADNDADCNDGDSGINPAASESCDGRDDDCDGLLLAHEEDSNSNGALDCAEPHTLSASVSGAGELNSTPTGIVGCAASSGDCSESYAFGTLVSLTPVPEPGWDFGGWSGACSGGPTTAVAMDHDLSCAATFDPRLIVRTTLGGSIFSAPEGINECTSSSGSCSANYPEGTHVTLFSNPDDGWLSTGCTGSGCEGGEVTVSSPITCDCAFEPTLSVVIIGSGTVSDPSHTCNSDGCSWPEPMGSMVTLVATSSSGGGISWSGDCAAAGLSPVSTVTMFQPMQCSVIFD